MINRISDEHLTVLNQRVQNRFDSLFLGGFTTGGSGHGLRICTDFVTNAFGLSSAEECVQGGYVGARIIKNYFVSWFHWPIADEC